MHNFFDCLYFNGASKIIQMFWWNIWDSMAVLIQGFYLGWTTMWKRSFGCGRNLNFSLSIIQRYALGDINEKPHKAKNMSKCNSKKLKPLPSSLKTFVFLQSVILATRYIYRLKLLKAFSDCLTSFQKPDLHLQVKQLPFSYNTTQTPHVLFPGNIYSIKRQDRIFP